MYVNQEKVPYITICMPVRNEADFIQETLMQVLSQDYPADRYEIIVADGGSNDGTREIAEGIANNYQQVILKHNPKRRSSAGRNLGFQTGKGDIFLVLDGHCYIPHGKLLRNIVDCFKVSGADILGRPQPLDPPGLTNFQKAVALARNSRIGHSGDSLIYSDFEGFVSPVSHGAVYKRHVFDRIGYVDEAFDACEDVEFNLRVEQAGFKTYMSPSIAIKYYPRKSLAALFRQMTRYGNGRFALAQKHPRTLSLNSLIPPGFVLFLALLPFLFLIKTILGMLGLLLVCIYLLLIMTGAVAIGSKHRFLHFYYLVPVFIAIHVGLGYGFASALLTEKLRCKSVIKHKQDKREIN